MAFVKDVLVEEYISLSEKLEFYSNKKSEAYFKTIDLAQEVVLMQRNECEQDEEKKTRSREYGIRE